MFPRTEDNTNLRKTNPKRTNELGQIPVGHGKERPESAARRAQSRQTHCDLRLPAVAKQILQVSGQCDRFVLPTPKTEKRTDANSPKSGRVCPLRTGQSIVEVAF